MAVKAKRVLDKDVYDTLELSCLAYGGIGQPNVFVYGHDFRPTAPVCMLGHCAFAVGDDNPWVFPVGIALLNPLRVACRRAGLDGMESDLAVRAINRRLSRHPGRRVSFRQWCKELGVVRGE